MGTAVSDVAENVGAGADAVAEEVKDVASDISEGVNEAVEGSAEETTEASAPAVADSAAKKFGVWDKEVWTKYNWKNIWGKPAIFCLIFAIIFALLGKEPKAAEEETVEGGSK